MRIASFDRLGLLNHRVPIERCLNSNISKSQTIYADRRMLNAQPANIFIQLLHIMLLIPSLSIMHQIDSQFTYDPDIWVRGIDKMPNQTISDIKDRGDLTKAKE